MIVHVPCGADGYYALLSPEGRIMAQGTRETCEAVQAGRLGDVWRIGNLFDTLDKVG